MVQDYFPALITAIATLGAALIVLVVNQFVEWRNRKNQINSVRLLIRLEIGQNLKMLSELWDNSNSINNSDDIKDDDLDNDPKAEKRLLASKLSDSCLPVWIDTAWKSQQSFLPIALDEDEIKVIQDLYNNLYTINSIHSSLLSLAELDKQDLRAANSRTRDPNDMLDRAGIRDIVMQPIAFMTKSPDLWNQFERITFRLLKNGNPLKLK